MAEAKPFKPPKKRPAAKSDKLEVVKVLVIAIISFGIGFALVFLLFRPTSSEGETEEPDEPPPEADEPPPEATESD